LLSNDSVASKSLIDAQLMGATFLLTSLSPNVQSMFGLQNNYRSSESSGLVR
jgi:hypothetical protein